MIDLGWVTNRDFCSQDFTIERSVSVPQNEGEFTQTIINTFQRKGSIQPANEADIVEFFPEGDRGSDYIKVYSSKELYLGQGDDVRSDSILYNGKKFRVVANKKYDDYGYWIAFCEAKSAITQSPPVFNI